MKQKMKQRHVTLPFSPAFSPVGPNMAYLKVSWPKVVAMIPDNRQRPLTISHGVQWRRT